MTRHSTRLYGEREPDPRPAPFPTQTVRAGGLSIHHVDVGPPDAPAVLLLPGLISTHRYFRRNIGALATRFRVLAPDLPGFGRSEKPDAPYTIAWFVDQVRAFLDAKGVARAHVAGNSLGGQVAMALALADPARVERLVLVSPAGLSPFPRVVTRLVEMGTRAALPVVGLPVLPRIPETAFALLFRAAFPTRPDIARSYTRGYAEGAASPEYPLFLRAALRSVRGVLATPALPAATGIESPTLIIWGARDIILPARAAPRLRRAIPRARLLVYPDSGHCAMVDQAERWNRDVGRFLDGEPVGE